MKKMNKIALFLLIVGLLLVSGVPLLSRYLFIPDSIKGFLMGFGLTLELLALVKFRKGKNAC